MLRRIFLLLLLTGAITAQAQTKKPAPKAAPAKKPVPAKTTAAPSAALKNQNDSMSYAMGLSVGEYLKSQGVTNINMAALNKAIDQALKGAPTLFDMNTGNMVMQRAAMSRMSQKAAAEKEKGRQFLVENKKKASVKETASGLQYEVLVAGNGPKPTLQDTIVVHYAGRLIDGKEFDSSYSRGEPITIPVAGVIPGWTEAMQLMPTGSKWRLFLPSSLAYGDRGAGPDIPAGAALVFDVELLQVGTKKK